MKNTKEKRLLTGNEAIARGAYEAGVRVATAYPGTPSTEILENISRYPEIYSQWSVNEKVAMEVASGSSIAGATQNSSRDRPWTGVRPAIAPPSAGSP